MQPITTRVPKVLSEKGWPTAPRWSIMVNCLLSLIIMYIDQSGFSTVFFPAFVASSFIPLRKLLSILALSALYHLKWVSGLYLARFPRKLRVEDELKNPTHY